MRIDLSKFFPRASMRENHKKDFINLFQSLWSVSSGKKVIIHPMVLKIQDLDFCYRNLVDSLSNILITYSLSRKTVEEYLTKDKWWQLTNLAKNKLRDSNSNLGEIWELLLYSLLESHLQAPKIISKIELKTNHNDYAKGSDWIHLLKTGINEFQIIFWESKLKNTAKECMEEALWDIQKFINRKKDNPDSEIKMVSNLLNQEFNDDEYEVIRDILLPTESSIEIYQNKSFAIFAWFDYIFPENRKDLTDKELQELINKDMEALTQELIGSISGNIVWKWLDIHHFYIYFFPFTDIQTNRKHLIEMLESWL